MTFYIQQKIAVTTFSGNMRNETFKKITIDKTIALSHHKAENKPTRPLQNLQSNIHCLCVPLRLVPLFKLRQEVKRPREFRG